MYKLRHIEGKLRLMAQSFKVILVVGARQVGKSTLLKNAFPHATHITFDPLEDVHHARKDPAFFFQKFPKPLILDEIQYAPELLSTLKRIVDEDQQPGQYFLTGSHNLNTIKAAAESMAGRVGIIDLDGMTTYEQTETFSFSAAGQHQPPLWIEHYLKDSLLLTEQCTKTTEQPIEQALWRGSLPATLAISSQLIPDYFSSYLQTYVHRDIRLLTNVKDLNAFRQFVGLISALTGQELNYRQLGREVDIDPKTARLWLTILQHGYQWWELLPYSRNTIKRVVSTKTKGYLKDTGLACHLMRIPTPADALNHPARGALFETLVINTIISMLNALSIYPGIYYWRTRNGAEVDLVLEYNNALYPIEIKMKGTLSSSDGSGLRAFRQTYEGSIPVKTGLIIYAGTRCEWYDRHTITLPWNALCR